MSGVTDVGLLRGEIIRVTSESDVRLILGKSFRAVLGSTVGGI
jgi:hypothetical protein